MVLVVSSFNCFWLFLKGFGFQSILLLQVSEHLPIGAFHDQYISLSFVNFLALLALMHFNSGRLYHCNHKLELWKSHSLFAALFKARLYWNVKILNSVVLKQVLTFRDDCFKVSYEFLIRSRVNRWYSTMIIEWELNVLNTAEDIHDKLETRLF